MSFSASRRNLATLLRELLRNPSEKEFRRAIELDANYATAHQWYAEFLDKKAIYPVEC